MRSPLTAPRTPRLCAAAVAAALMAMAPLALCSTPAVHVIAKTASHPQVTVRQAVAPLARTSPIAPARTESSAWQQLGPMFFTGQVNCAASCVLTVPVIDIGSDGNGYWEGYAAEDYGWTEHGHKLGTGIEQMVVKLEFPDTGGYFERRTIVGTDGSLRYSDDQGATWSPVTVTCINGEVLAPGKRRIVGSDMYSNVEYLVAHTFSSTSGDSGYVLALSFDSGATFNEWNYVDNGRAADVWISRNGDGRALFAYDDGSGDVTMMAMSESDFIWSTLDNRVPSSEGSTYPDLELTAQSFQDGVQRMWVLHGDWLYGTTDGGTTWSQVRPAFTPGGTRGLCASIGTPDLLLWSDLDRAPYFGTLYRSTDDGATATAFDNSWPWNPSKVNDHPTNIDVVQWGWAFNLNARVRRADGSVRTHAVPRQTAASAPAHTEDTSERFFVSSSGGMYVITPGDTAGTTVTYSGLANAQVNDVASLRGSDPYETYTASRDHGLMRTFSSSPTSCDGYTAVSTSVGNYVSDIATTYGPNMTDWVWWSMFPDGFVLIGGAGVVNGAFPDGYESNVLHRWLVADPSDPYSCYTGRDAIEHSTWNSGSNSVSTADISGPIGAPHGGIDGFAIAKSNHNRWYLSMADGTLMYSSTAGATWSTSTSIGPAMIDATQLARVKIVVNPGNPLEAWCIGSSVAHTLNGGVKWNAADIGLPVDNTLAFGGAYDSVAFNRMYLAAASGAYYWNGVRWVSIVDASVPAVQFRAVEAVPSQGVMRFATWGSGLWDYRTGGTTAVSGTTTPTLALAARQNPVRGRGLLDFALPQQGRARLDMMDVAGRRVATLVDGILPAGPHSATIDTAPLQAGVYFARLATTQGTRSTRVVVLR